MINTAIISGNYGEASSFIRFHNLKRENCVVIMGKKLFHGYREIIKNCQIVLTENAVRNTAYDLAVMELTRRIKPEMGDGIISVAGRTTNA